MIQKVTITTWTNSKTFTPGFLGEPIANLTICNRDVSSRLAYLNNTL